jgi:hypothetical protein
MSVHFYTGKDFTGYKISLSPGDKMSEEQLKDTPALKVSNNVKDPKMVKINLYKAISSIKFDNENLSVDIKGDNEQTQIKKIHKTVSDVSKIKDLGNIIEIVRVRNTQFFTTNRIIIILLVIAVIGYFYTQSQKTIKQTQK